MDTPKLRRVAAYPTPRAGQRYIALRDPAGYPESVLLLPQAVVEIIALFDGERGIIDVQADLARRHDGLIVPRSDIEAVIATLDEHGFLESETFAARRASIDGAFLPAAPPPAPHPPRAP